MTSDELVMKTGWKSASIASFQAIINILDAAGLIVAAEEEEEERALLYKLCVFSPFKILFSVTKCFHADVNVMLVGVRHEKMMPGEDSGMFPSV